MRQDKKRRDKPAIALVLCFCMMALVSLFVVKANIDKVKNNMEGSNVTDAVKEKAVDGSRTDNIIDSADNTSDQGSGTSGNTDDQESTSEYIIPVSGEIIMGYSSDMPVYWKTLDQYMTHSGIDIAAPSGTSAAACAAGTVTKVWEDDRFGISAEISHGEGITSIYGNLARDGLAETGDVLKQGDTVGKIGQSSMFEFDDPPHLHFEIRENGAESDPGKYISF